jgi:xylan 1,4-beta-xylosidase
MGEVLRQTVERGTAGEPLRHFWSFCVGAGRANEGLRAAWQEHLAVAARHCGFRYCRFHGLFHDDMFVLRSVNGRLRYNWQYVDELFDRMLALGVRPFVELGFCPRVLATVPETVFWWKGHGSPPNDYGQWADLVEAFARHCLARYGADEVRQWYFEVWNEPNLEFFFAGTKSQYFELYRVTALRLKGVDAGLRVGGPATSNFVPDGRFDGETEDKAKALIHKVDDLGSLTWEGVWIREFLAFCAERRLPLDFLSTHPYPTDYALDTTGTVSGRSRPADSTRQDLEWLRRTMDAGPYPKAEIHLTEWSSSPSHRDHTHDHLPAAAYVAKCNVESIGLVDSLSYWTFTDVFEEDGAGPTALHGGFGLISFQGWVKPAFHAYRFLHQLGDEILWREPGGVVTRDSRSGRLSALFYHYPPEMPLAVPMSMHAPDAAQALQRVGDPRRLAVEWRGMPPGAAIGIETLDLDHGCVTEAWRGMGSPEPPTRQQAALLSEAAWNTRRERFAVPGDGVFRLDRPLLSWSVILASEVP